MTDSKRGVTICWKHSTAHRSISPADEIGMEAGDIVEALGRSYVTTLDELDQVLEFVDPGDRINISILRIDPPTVYRHRVAIRAG